MRPELEMVRREGHEIVVVRVHHDVPTQISQFDEVFLPRSRPAVRPRIWDHDRVDTEKDFGEANIEVGVEFAPVFGEVDRSPAAGDLGEVRGRVFCYVVGCEHGSGVEECPSLPSRFDDFWLVQADPEHMRGLALVFAVPIPVRGMNDRWGPLSDGKNTDIEVGSSSTKRRKEVTLPHRLRGLTRKNDSSADTMIPQSRKGGRRG